VRETSVERRLVKKVREAGGMCEKVMPVVAGLPDRLVLLRGVVYLVETKAPDGEVRPAQRVWHGKAARAGVTVHVLWSSAQVDAWVESRP